MLGLISNAIKYRKLTLSLVVIMVLLGMFNYKLIPKYDSPQVSMPFAMITCVYPGASPEEVEKLVTKEIEDELYELEGYDFMYSYAMDSISVTILALEVDVDEKAVFSDMRRRLQDIQSKLPEEALGIEVDTKLGETAGVIIALSGENYSYEVLADYADIVESRLSAIDGVKRFKIIGDLKRELIVEVDHKLLSLYRISLNDIVGLIGAQNLAIPSGKIDNGESKINVVTEGRFEKLSELSNLIIDGSEADGSVVRLKDVANVYYQLEESTQKVKHNGKGAVLLAGYFKDSENILISGEQVQKGLEALKTELPDDLDFEEVLFQPSIVGKSVDEFTTSLLQGIGLVILVVFIGMGFRNAIIVSFAIPVSIFLSFTIMRGFGIEIHKISIAGLIIALGMLVDNAIVVSDAIQVRLDGGEDKLSACTGGVMEVAVPILTSTLTTIATFSPLLFLNSVTGEFIFSIPAIVSIALIASYGVALVVTPTLAYIFFGTSKRAGKKSLIGAFFEDLLRAALNRKITVVVLVAMMIVGAGALSESLGLQFFPNADLNMIYIDVKSDIESDLDYTERLTDDIGRILDQEQVIESYTVSIGDGIPRFFYALPQNSPSSDKAQFLITLNLENTLYENNSAYKDALQEKLNISITGGKATVMECVDGEAVKAPVVLRISGGDVIELGEIAEEVKTILATIPGAVNIESNNEHLIYEYYVDINTDKASAYGLSKYDIQNEISIAIGGRYASVLRLDDDHNIKVKSDITSFTQLENLKVKSQLGGQKILLKDIAKIKLKDKIPVINRYKQSREVTVTSLVSSGSNSVTIQESLRNQLDGLKRTHPEVSFTFDGEEQAIEREFGSVTTLTIFAVCAVYVILMVQFYSFKIPLIIFTTIPLSALGSVIGLYLFKQPLSFTALLGIVSLFGIVVNNAIVLIDFINAEIRAGSGVEHACINAVSKRMRPILLSTITTVMGLVPLVMSGSPMFMPMAIALMSGLLISTLLTLIVIPVVYHTVLTVKFRGFRKNTDALQVDAS